MRWSGCHRSGSDALTDDVAVRLDVGIDHVVQSVERERITGLRLLEHVLVPEHAEEVLHWVFNAPESFDRTAGCSASPCRQDDDLVLVVFGDPRVVVRSVVVGRSEQGHYDLTGISEPDEPVVAMGDSTSVTRDLVNVKHDAHSRSFR